MKKYKTVTLRYKCSPRKGGKQYKVPFCSFHISLSNAFWRQLFLFFAISSWNLHDMRQRFFMYAETKQLNPTKDIEFPYRPPL